MKQIRNIFIMTFLVLISNPALGQVYSKVVFNSDTFYSFNTKTFFDSAFEKPKSVPDGNWIILNSDSLPIYIFNTLDNCINGDYTEYRGGILKAKGVYRMDSLWTFRFDRNDDRFKVNTWLIYGGFIIDSTNNKTIGFEWAYNRIYDNYYPNGAKRFEKHGRQIEIWYYPSGILKSMTTTYKRDKDDITIGQSFDSTGQLTQIVYTKTTPIVRNKYLFGGGLVTSDTVEYNENWKVREVIDDNKHITTIFYGDFGQEVTRTRQKKVKSKK